MAEPTRRETAVLRRKLREALYAIGRSYDHKSEPPGLFAELAVLENDPGAVASDA
jgi:hypothetical protein